MHTYSMRGNRPPILRVEDAGMERAVAGRPSEGTGHLGCLFAGVALGASA